MSSYRSNVSNEVHRYLFPLKLFHNKVKEWVYLYIGNQIPYATSIEIGVGYLNDLNRMIKAKIQKVYAIEPDLSSIDKGSQILAKKTQPKPTVQWINKTFQHVSENDLSEVNVIFSMFSSGYIFDSKESYQKFVNLSQKFAKDYVVIVHYDGKRILEFLKKNKRRYIIKKNGKFLLDISLRGKNELSVFIGSIGVRHNEWIINFDYLDSLMKSAGFRLIEQMGFDSFFNILSVAKNPSFKIFKSYSSLHSVFIWKRIF